MREERVAIGIAQNSVRQLLRDVFPKRVQREIRRVLYHYRRWTYESRVVRRTVFGTNLEIWIGDQVAKDWYDHDVPLLPGFEFIGERRKCEGATVFYLGAHYGIYAIALAKRLGTRCRVVALEANPDHASAALRNVRLNKCHNVKVIKGAISNRSGTLDFTLGHRVASDDRTVPTISINAYTIDDLSEAEGEPDIVIVDVEGYEEKALAGAFRILDKGALWCVEVHVGCGLEVYGGSLSNVLSFFNSRPYELFMARDYGKDVVRRFDRNDPVANGRFHLIAIPTEEALFLPQESV